jgi:hypothetical protein
MKNELGLTVMLLPRFAATPSRLRCSDGWSAETTAAFHALEFETIELLGTQGKEFTIPALGPKAATVRQMTLDAPVPIHGLDQFCNLELLSVSHMPANGLDGAMFPALQILSVGEWNKGFANLELLFSHLASFSCDKWNRKFAPYVFHANKLTSICISAGYEEADCTDFQSLPQLTSLALHASRINSLKGLECCKNLEGLYLTSLKNISELVPLANFPRLRAIHLDGLNGVMGAFQLAGPSQLADVTIVKCQNMTVDLAGIENMAELGLLWLAVPDSNLDLDAAFARPRLRMLQVVDSNIGDAELERLAACHGRTLLEIERVGPKNNKSLRLTFKEQDEWLAARGIHPGKRTQSVAPPVAAPSRPNTVMGDVLWRFDGSRFDDQSHFSYAVRQYQVDVANEDNWSPDKIALSVAKVRVKYRTWEAGEEIDTMVELSSENGRDFTALELLFKIHNAVVDPLREVEHHFFEGLTLDSKPSTKAPPRYVLNQGS